MEVELFSLSDEAEDIAESPAMFAPVSFMPVLPQKEAATCAAAPRLRPAADPFDLDSLDLSSFALPPAADLTGGDKAFSLDDDDDMGEESPVAPPAPRLRPAADPVGLGEMPPLSLPPTCLSADGLGAVDSDEEGSILSSASFAQHMAVDEFSSTEASEEEFLPPVCDKRCTEVADVAGKPAPSPAASLGKGINFYSWQRTTSSCSTEAPLTPRHALQDRLEAW